MISIHIQVNRDKSFHLSILGPAGSIEPACIFKQNQKEVYK